MKTILVLGTCLCAPALLGFLLSFGLLERFQDGLLDESAMARVNVYGLFDLVSWNDILFGTDIGMIRNLALQHFDLQFIESAIVMLVFQLGLFGTIAFLGFLAQLIWVLLRGGLRPSCHHRDRRIFHRCRQQ